MAWGARDGNGAAQTARVIAEAAPPLPRPTTAQGRRTATRILLGTLAAGALVLGGIALRTAAASDEASTMTVAQLDDALGITAAGSRELDRAPGPVLQAALDRQAGDSAALGASGVPVGSDQRLGVAFRTSGRAPADRLTALLARTTRFTVVVAAPTSADPQWTVSAITPRAPITVPITHQLTERMIEVAWRAGDAAFTGWRVAGR
ncbi:MAG TPA: hypothetical protein VGO26_08270 [Amnibacterium sp.]|jgi:hypothetical protein|nr:hypothetical protein [Amnibacterium sp.]